MNDTHSNDKPSYWGCQISFHGVTRIQPERLISQKTCLSFCSQFDQNLKDFDEKLAPNPLAHHFKKANLVPTYGWINGKVDITQGFGAMDDLLALPSVKLGPKNLDLGGGKFNHLSAYLRLFGIENVVFDPFGRSESHNQEVLKKTHSFDTVTSHSVLNVILKREDRAAHIQQAFDALKPGGTAYFKIYEGNGSGKASAYQNHLKTKAYTTEIQAVFLEKPIKLLANHFLIIAFKPK